MSTHAELSPSSAARWMTCPGSVAACRGLTDESSSFADEGTDAHELAAVCLVDGSNAAVHVGRTMGCGNVVDSDMAGFVQQYIDFVRDVTDGGELFVEQRLPISSITGEVDAYGTADAVGIVGDELVIVDLKYGRGVAVDAIENPQLQIYALAALEEFSIVRVFKTVRMCIHQPRVGGPSEYAQTVEELMAFGETVKAAAEATRNELADLVPTDKGCKFCRAKATCPALAAEVKEVFEAVDPDDVPSDDLAAAMNMVDRIEGWCKAVRAETERRLLDGREVYGWKLVQGKRGNRQWTDKTAAEELLKAMRVKHDQMYDYSVISPTSAEKLFKAEVIGPRQWPRVLEIITQTEGKPSVAPASDKRPALVLDEFSPVFPTDLT